MWGCRFRLVARLWADKQKDPGGFDSAAVHGSTVVVIVRALFGDFVVIHN